MHVNAVNSALRDDQNLLGMMPAYAIATHVVVHHSLHAGHAQMHNCVPQHGLSVLHCSYRGITVLQMCAKRKVYQSSGIRTRIRLHLGLQLLGNVWCQSQARFGTAAQHS